jgi:uncharacterized membrane protein SirB2
MYPFIKYIHITCALLSITGFILRGIWMMRESKMLLHPVVKILPHIIDAVLLVSALILIFIIDQYPFINHWLTAKVIALLIYIFLGMAAFKWAKTKASKITYWLLAVVTFLYIVSAALTKVPSLFIVF